MAPLPDEIDSRRDPWGRLGVALSRIALTPVYWLLPLLFWTLLALGSLWWNWRALEQHTLDLAANQARQIAAMFESMRLWNADHGGVYVPVTAQTQPNPYLEDPQRDIELPDGRRLTKVNPAYMTRQLIEQIREHGEVVAHLTSLKPINPGNQADPWERRALLAFEQGLPEHQELFAGEHPQFRYMMPLVTTKECLQCHRRQGYEVGDIRGGLSVSFSPLPFQLVEEQNKTQLVVAHAAVWLILVVTTLLALARFRYQILSLRRANAGCGAQVERRTGELRVQVREREQAEQRLQLLIDSSAQGVLAVDRRGCCTVCNPTASRLLGYRPEQLLGQPLRDVIAHSGADGKPRDVRRCPLNAAYRQGLTGEDLDAVFWRADGTALAVEYRAQPIRLGGTLDGAVITFSDITERKRRELQLRILSAAVEHSPTALAVVDDQGQIGYANPELARMMGVPVEALPGRAVAGFRSGETPQTTYDEIWRTIRAGGTWRGEVSALRADGESFWQRLSVSPIGEPPHRHFVAVFQDITEEKRAQDEVWRQANFDALTGLPNRSLFADRLGHQLAHAERGREGLALLYIDLDGFKQVNDRLGHDTGDALLREAAARMRACLRATDTVARLGGDEFAVILPAVGGRRELEFVAARLIEALGEPFEFEGRRARVAGSVGIACHQPGVGLEELVRRADSAMYAAKRAGGSLFRFYG